MERFKKEILLMMNRMVMAIILAMRRMELFGVILR